MNLMLNRKWNRQLGLMVLTGLLGTDVWSADPGDQDQ